MARIDTELKILPLRLRAIWQRLHDTYQAKVLELYESAPRSDEFDGYRHGLCAVIASIMGACIFDWSDDLRTIKGDIKAIKAELKRQHSDNCIAADARQQTEVATNLDYFRGKLLWLRTSLIFLHTEEKYGLLEMLDFVINTRDRELKGLSELFPDSAKESVGIVREFHEAVKEEIQKREIKDPPPAQPGL